MFGRFSDMNYTEIIQKNAVKPLCPKGFRPFIRAAKGVGRVTGARVQIPASPHEKALQL